VTILGENLKKLRERAGFTVRQLSEQSGVSKSVISEIENGKSKNPKYDTLIKLATVIGVKVEKLTEMAIEHEYMLTDVEEAMMVILKQPELHLHGELLSDEAKLSLANSIKMALKFAEELQNQKKKEK
jgi:transcriptional regulator with XRE-family HTH domain